MNGKAVAFGAVLVLGIILGNKTASNEVDFVKVPHTVVVHEKGETKYKFPPSCLDALAAATEINRNAELYDLTAGEQLDIISDGRQAIVEKNMNGLTALERRQRKLNGETTDYLKAFSNSMQNYRVALKDCKEDIK